MYIYLALLIVAEEATESLGVSILYSYGAYSLGEVIVPWFPTWTTYGTLK